MTSEQAAEAIRELREFAKSMRARADQADQRSLRMRSRVIAEQAEALAESYAEEQP